MTLLSRAARLVLGPCDQNGHKGDCASVGRGSYEAVLTSACSGLGRHSADWPPSVVARRCRPHAQLSARSRRRDSPRSGGCQSGHGSISSAARWPEPEVMPPPQDFWHIDPDDGEVFPQRDAYCFDVSFRHGVNTREIKRIWELSRLQFLVPLAAYAVLSGNRKGFELGRRLCSVVDGRQSSFSRAELGSGIELALRAHFSCAMPLHDWGRSASMRRRRQAVLQFFFAHVYWIKRFPSLHSSANNHRIAELAGLIVGTTMAPGIPRRGRLARKELARSAYRD